MAERVASPVFVGRRAELAVLEGALSSPERTVAVLVGGEAGAGKSRLVSEFTASASAAGAKVLAGACVALGSESLPYAPFMSVLGQLAAEVGAEGIDALVGPGRIDLARLAPDLRRPGDDHRPSGAADRAVLFQVVLRALDGASAEAPLVVVIEDLHWADGSSRELLAFLVGRLRGKVLVVATYRNDEVHRRHPLRPFLAEAARSERVARLDLAPLTPVEVTMQLEAIAGAALPPSVVQAVVGRAEGNPFFAEELLAAGGGEELPPDLAEVLTARLSALPEAAQDLVGVAAVAGRRVRHELLAEAARADGDIGSGLREAISHQVLVAEPDGTYAFRHALLAEAAYAELLPTERAAMHASYAAALSEHPEWATTPAGATGELAHHWVAARDPARALGATVAAAAAATETYAFAAAHALLEQALDLWVHVPDAAGLVQCDQVQLLQRAADAALMAGATARAIALVRTALDHLDTAAERARAAMLYERLARLLSEVGDGEGSLAASRAAAALMPTEPSRERAQVIGGEARALLLFGRYRESIIRAESAVAVARSAGARREEGYALNTLGCALGRVGQPEKAVNLLEEALAIAETVGSLEDMRRAYKNLMATLEDSLGDPRRSAAVGLEGGDRLEALSYEEGATLLRAGAAIPLVSCGSWAEAESLAETALAGTPDDGAAWQARLAAGTVALRRGDYATAHLHLEHARSLFADSAYADYRAMVGAAQAELALAEGLVEEAGEIVDGTLKAVGETDAQDYVRLLASLGLRAEADLRQRSGRNPASTPGAEPDRAAVLIGQARATAVVIEGQTVPASPQGRALGALCEAEWSRVQRRHDAALWAEVAGAWGESYPYEAAYARRRQAEAHLAAGDKDAAATSLREAFATASRLGAGPLVAEIEALARRARMRLTPAATERQPAAGGTNGLTKREAEVLALVAAGHTNHQIAEALYMSEKTASVHVSRILTKLGVTNRGQAAALAHRMQLVEERSSR